MSHTTNEPKAETVKAALLHESLLSKVSVIKSRRRGTFADIVSAYGGPGIDEEYRKVLAELQADAEAS